MQDDDVDTFQPAISQEVELTTMTITNIINKNINIEVIARYMNMNEYIIGIGNDCVERGVYQKKTKKYYKRRQSAVLNTRKIKKQQKQQNNSERINKNKSKKDFYNQVTFITMPNGTSDNIIDVEEFKKNKTHENITLINVKLFNNGRLVMVGCKSTEDAHKAGNKVVDLINTNPQGHIVYQISDNIAKEYDEREIVKFLTTHIKPLKAILKYGSTIKNTNDNISEQYQFISSNQDLIALFNLDLDNVINELRGYIPVKKKGKFKNYYNNNNNNNNVSNISKTNTTDLSPEIIEPPKKKMDPYGQKLVMSLIKIYNVMNIYFQEEEIFTFLESDTSNKLATDMLNKLIMSYSMNKMIIEADFPIYVGDKIVYEENRMKIDMIDSCFKLNFNLNRANVQQILNNKYGLVSTYNSDTYQGVNSKYICKLGCTATEHNMCNCKKTDKKKHLCKCPCTCKEISNLIFRKGAIIITGARSWEQVLDSYHYISTVLINEYENIVSKQADPIPKRLLKNINSFSKDNFTYILPTHIRSNQKNSYLIERYGFDHLKN